MSALQTITVQFHNVSLFFQSSILQILQHISAAESTMK